MAAGSVSSVVSPFPEGIDAFTTLIQTWLTANATGVIKAVLLVDEKYVAILEVPPTV